MAGEAARLYLRSLDEFAASPAAGTEGAAQPFFSHDGEWVGFFAAGRLKKVAVTGGAPVDLCSWENPWGAVWLPDERIVFANPLPNRESLFEVSAEGGERRLLADADLGDLEFPTLLPGGESFVVTTWTGGTYQTARISTLSRDGRESRRVLDGGALARYLSNGHLVYARGRELLAGPFDPALAQTTGPPVELLDDLLVDAIFDVPQFATSPAGVLAYVTGQAVPERPRLAWFSARGRQTISEGLGVRHARLSPGRPAHRLQPDRSRQLRSLDPGARGWQPAATDLGRRGAHESRVDA